MSGQALGQREDKMIPKRILVGHDGSPEAEEAFEAALDWAALTKARLAVVSVATPPEPPTRVETEATLEATTEHYEQMYEQLLRLAADTGVDLMLVGHKGRSGVRKWRFGSASQRVVSYATCSVLVVRK